MLVDYLRFENVDSFYKILVCDVNLCFMFDVCGGGNLSWRGLIFGLCG